MKNEPKKMEVYGLLVKTYSNGHFVDMKAHCYMSLEVANNVYEYATEQPVEVDTTFSLIKGKIKEDALGNQERMNHLLLLEAMDSECTIFATTSLSVSGGRFVQVNTLALEAERQERQEAIRQ